MAHIFQDDVQVNEDLIVLGNTTTTGHLITTTKADIITDNGNQTIALVVGADGKVLKANSATVTGLEWGDTGAGGGGEANSGENVGASGVGVFFQKSGVNLQFKNIDSLNNLLSVIDDTGNTQIDFRVNQSSIDINNLGNTPLLVSGGGTGQTTLTSGAVLIGNGTGAIDDIKLAPSGDFVGTTDQQDLTNKNLVDTSTFIVDASDNTIKIGFNAVGGSGTTTTLASSQSVNRTLTLPDATDTLVGRLTTDTFSNKTIVAASNNVAADALKAASGAVLVRVVNAAEPISGQVLTATSNTAANWQTPSSQATASNAGEEGVGVFIAKVGNDLRFKNIASDSNNTVNIINNTSANSIQIAVIESALDLNNFGGTPLNVSSGGTGQTTLTSGAVLVGNGTGAINDVKLAPSGDFVGTTDQQDLTNKNLVDTSTFIVDAGDNTIRIGFDAAGTSGTTTTLTSSQTVNRTLTLPDATDTVVARATTDTLTNKTIVDASNNVASDALKANAGNILVRVIDAAEPSSGQVLTATSNTTANWQTPSAQATASNEGVGGVGVFIQKTGNNLEFKNINSLNNLITIIDDTTNNEIDLLVNQGSIDINNLGNTPLLVSGGGTGQTTLTSGNVLVGNGTGAVLTTKAAPTGDFVGTTDQQDLTNKNLVDTSTFIVDTGDDTLRIGFDAAGTSGTTTTLTSSQTVNRTLTLPDATDTIVARATTDTLTNKTIVDASNNVAADALKANAGNILVRVVDAAEPSTGQVLTATSNTTANWQTPSSQATASNAGEEGVGVFIAKVGNDLRFKNIASDANNTVNVIDNTSANSIQIAVIESALDLNNFGGTPLNVSSGGTGQTTLTSGAVLVGNGTGAIDDVKLAPSGDFVGTTDQQDLTNKNLVDSSTFIVDNSDNTIRIGFNAAGTSGTTTTFTSSQTSNVILTFPDATDTLVGRDTTDTMTNKTITLLSAGNTRITDVSTPTAGTDAANKNYVDMVAQGLDLKESVRAATITSGDLNTDFENGDSVDGVTLSTGDRLLIKNQGNVENGIYIVAASGAPSRSSDMAIGANVAGSFTFVEEGTINEDSGWVVTNDQGNDTVGSNTLVWSIFTTTGGITANNAGISGVGVFIQKTGNNLEFKTINSFDNLTTIINDTGNNEIDIQINQTNFDINNIGNTPLLVSGGGTGQTTLTSGNVLVGNGIGAVLTTKVAPTGDFVGTTDTQTLTNKTIVAASNNIAADALKANAGNILVRVVDAAEPSTGQVLTATSNTTANWQTPTGVTTASNEGVGGVGIFIQKTGNNLEFKNINTLNNLLSVIDDTTNNEIDLLINQGSIDINNLGNTPLLVSGGGTGQTTLTSGAVLVGNGTGAIDDVKLAPSGDFVGTTDQQDLTNKNLVDTSTFIVDAGDNTLRIGFDAAGTSGTTTTLTSSQTVNRTLTLPDATDTIVARATTDTLTNKTIVDASNNVASDALKANAGNILVRVVDAAEPSTNQVLTATSNTTANWQTPSSVTTASNEGVSGVGVFIQKTGNNLEFKNINSLNNLLSIVDDTTNNEIDLLINQGSIDINNLGNTPLLVSGGGTGQTTLTSGAVLVGNGTGAIDDVKLAPSGDFVGTTDQQDLTNKNLVDTSTFIVDAGDDTLRIGFDAAGTSGTTTTLTSSQTVDRTLTLPDATDTVVARATTDTLTNKTIVDASNNVASDALKANAGNILVRVVDAAEPSSGQVLTATSNTTANWQNVNIVRKVAYNLSGIEIRARSTSFDDTVYFVWDDSAYNNYSNGNVRFYTTIVNKNVEVRWYDDTGATSLGSTVAETTGIYNFSVTNPSANSQIILQVRRGTGSGANPRLTGIHVDYDS